MEPTAPQTCAENRLTAAALEVERTQAAYDAYTAERERMLDGIRDATQGPDIDLGAVQVFSRAIEALDDTTGARAVEAHVAALQILRAAEAALTDSIINGGCDCERCVECRSCADGRFLDDEGRCEACVPLGWWTATEGDLFTDCPTCGDTFPAYTVSRNLDGTDLPAAEPRVFCAECDTLQPEQARGGSDRCDGCESVECECVECAVCGESSHPWDMTALPEDPSGEACVPACGECMASLRDLAEPVSGAPVRCLSCGDNDAHAWAALDDFSPAVPLCEWCDPDAEASA